MSVDVTRRDALKLVVAAGAGAALLPRGAFAATSASYDDGSDAVPGGLAGDPERVIVVGAGWAGLTIANALRSPDIDHVVLDARERIGGRAHTRRPRRRAGRGEAPAAQPGGRADRWLTAC